MISMQGVPSSLIARNESWVRKQAQALARNLPSNVEKADLIQVGLIAVAQASLSFEWEGDRESEEAKEAFARYARARVKGAMIDELRQMDHLSRGQRRKVKVIEIARERWRSVNGGEPGLSKLAELCGMSVDEISKLEQADQLGRMRSSSAEGDDEEHRPEQHPVTPQDEVEARVDTGIVMRRLEAFFARLPERERMVIDAYLGIGLTPSELAAEMQVSPSRVSQMFKATVERIAVHFGQPRPDGQRATDKHPDKSGARFAALMARREEQLRQSPGEGPWGDMMEKVLVTPPEQFVAEDENGKLKVDANTRWG